MTSAVILLSEIENSQRKRLSVSAGLETIAALIWIPQAAMISLAVGSLAGDAAGRSALVGAVGFVALALLRAGLGWIARGIAFRAAAQIVSDARSELSEHISLRAPRDSARTPSGALAALGAEKIEALFPYLTRYKPARLRALMVPLVIIAVAAVFSWTAALILLVAGPLIPLFMALIGIAAKDASARQMDEIGAASALFLDRLRGLVDIRLLAAESLVRDTFRQRADALRLQTMAVLRIAFLSSAVLELFAALGVALMAVYVGFSLLGILAFGSWGTPLSLANGLFLLMLAPEFFQPLRDFAAAWHDRAAALAVYDEFDAEVARNPLPILGTGEPAVPIAERPMIELVDTVAFTASVPLNATIAPGERVALVGASGSGKSALLAALAGFEPLTSGEIRIAGHVLDANTADGWRARIAWIGQRPHFVTGSIRANVALSGSPQERPRIAAALETAAASAFVARSPKALDTVLGETGHGVSGGEGRRLAIARAAFADREVILADEPTADLDAETSKAVIDGLLTLADRGATLIVATHDPVLAGRMDRLIRVGPL